MKSHITEEELETIRQSGLNFTKSPAIISGVSQSQFSIARHYGGCLAYGKNYVYAPPTDELIRADVVKALAKIRRDAEKSRLKVMAEKQGVLF